MTTNTIQLDTALRAATAGRRPALSAGWLERAGMALAALRRMHQRRRAISELARMSDWRLADLGIPRDRIREVVDGLIAREGPNRR